MDYKIIVGILVAIALLLLIIIIAIFRSARKAAESEYEDEYDEDDYEQEQIAARRRKAEERQRASARRDENVRRAQDIEDENEEDEEDEEEEERVPAKKQWKIVVENLDTWEKFSFIFYDNIGIGRKRENPEFEKYLIISDDPRVSKLHCAIISNAGKLYLKDMESRNGTYLNGKRLAKPIVLQKDDVIGIGETKLEIKKVMRERD